MSVYLSPLFLPNGKVRSPKQVLRGLDNAWRIRDFRGRQIELAASASTFLLFAAVFGFQWFFLPMAALLIQTGVDETRRFRITGHRFQTRRSIYLGATPHDANKRHLLRGWKP